MKYTQEKIDEAAKFGWIINPITGTWSSNCTVCGEYKVIPNTGSGACQACITHHHREN